jgi:hypothetical protein
MIVPRRGKHRQNSNKAGFEIVEALLSFHFFNKQTDDYPLR